MLRFVLLVGRACRLLCRAAAPSDRTGYFARYENDLATPPVQRPISRRAQTIRI